jgi:hypothetical protein
LPEIPWEPNRIWMWDASHFERARRVAYAVIDVVTRYWIGSLLTTEMSSTQVQVLFHAALEDQGLLDAATGELLRPDGRPPATRRRRTAHPRGVVGQRPGDDLR